MNNKITNVLFAGIGGHIGILSLFYIKTKIKRLPIFPTKLKLFYRNIFINQLFTNTVYKNIKLFI